MKWRKVADELERQAKVLVDENNPSTRRALLSMEDASDEAQVTVAAARVSAAIVLASIATALRAGLVANHQGGK